jgi:hypothetical protein
MFFVTWWKFRLLVSRSSLWKSHTGSSRAFLRFPDVIAVLSSILRCASWLSSPSSDIPVVCRLGLLFAGLSVRYLATLWSSTLQYSRKRTSPQVQKNVYLKPFLYSCSGMGIILKNYSSNGLFRSNNLQNLLWMPRQVGPLSPRHGASSGCGWRRAANILSKQSWRADKGWSSSLGGWAWV